MTLVRSLLEVVTGITDNKDLQTMFMYCWGDYGCPPSKTTFIMQVTCHIIKLLLLSSFHMFLCLFLICEDQKKHFLQFL